MKTIRFMLAFGLFFILVLACSKDNDNDKKTEICDNAKDDDGDGFIDKDDLDCTETGAECSNGKDDDGDGFIDGDDLDCKL